MSKGVKYDSGKPEMALVPVAAKVAIAQALGYGAKKYGKWNYKKGMEWTRLLSATERHLDAFRDREDTDPESGLSHLSHALASLSMLMDFYKNKLGTDDRYDKEEESQRVGAPSGSDQVSEIRKSTIKEVTG